MMEIKFIKKRIGEQMIELESIYLRWMLGYINTVRYEELYSSAVSQLEYFEEQLLQYENARA
jgi:hypothetical protein